MKLENKATESLSVQIDLDLGDDNPKPSWSKSLLDFSQPLGSECLPLNIPGLGPGPTTPAAPSPSGTSGGSSQGTCTPPGKTGICQKTSVSCAGDYVSGYCPGAADVQCCTDVSPSPATSAAAATPTTCKPPGKTGICQKTSVSCAGDYISGYCPGAANIQCCPDVASSPATPTTCKPPGKTGICQSTSTTCSGGDYISGYCPGAANIQCCPDADPTSTTAAANASPTTCTPPGKSGICQSTSLTCAGGSYISGYCPGDDNISKSS